MIQIVVFMIAASFILAAAAAWAAVWVVWQAIQLLMLPPLIIWHRHKAKGEWIPDTERIAELRTPAWAWFRRVWLD